MFNNEGAPDAAPTLDELDLCHFSYLAKGEVPDGYEATPIPGAFVAKGELAPPLPVLITAVLDVVERVDGELGCEAQLFSGFCLIGEDGRQWYELTSLSSFPFRGWITVDGGPQVEEDGPEL